MTSYGFEQEKPERLAGIEATWDPGTHALLESLGVGPGRRCLEAGAGGGSIAAWMAERVAPGGSMLATDIDTQHLDPPSGAALEIRRHDLTRDELPLGAFDVVHARSVHVEPHLAVRGDMSLCAAAARPPSPPAAG